MALLYLLPIATPIHYTLSQRTPTQSRISDRAFAGLIARFSERGGWFVSDNLVSNETTFQEVVPALRTMAPAGGAYLGVGPEQNFTYIAALRPQFAFIVDVRRENMLLHLMYKALMESSADRAEFLSRLFSRPRPPMLDTASSVGVLFDRYGSQRPDSGLFRRTLNEIEARLTSCLSDDLSPEDRSTIERILASFYASGPEIAYTLGGRSGTGVAARAGPTLRDLMTRGDLYGHRYSFLASEESYRTVRSFQLRNLIIPVVGDFGGSHALAEIGKFLRRHGTRVAAFYVSNVEAYLFHEHTEARFYENVARLPIGPRSVFIRAFVGVVMRDTSKRSTGLVVPSRSATVLASIPRHVQAFRDGRIRRYTDVVRLTLTG